MAGNERRPVKQQRSSEESEPGDVREAASGETAPDSAQGSGPGSIGAPSAPPSRTATQGGDVPVAGDGDGGGARTPTSSTPGPEEAGEREAGAPAAAHAVGVSIGRTTSGPEEEPGGGEAAVAREEAEPAAGGTAVAATTATTAAEGAAEEKAEAEAASPAAPAAAVVAAGASEAAAAAEPGSPKTGTASREAAGTTGAEAAASGAPATATATAAAASPPDGSAAEGGAPERPGRVSRPMVVAAAFAGALLLGAPFVVAAAQKDDVEPTRRAAAAAWKQAGQEGGYVPGTDPAGPDGVRVPGAPREGAPPVRGDKGPANHVGADAGDGPRRANGSSGAKAEKDGDGKGATGAGTAKGSTDAAGSTEKSGSGAKAPAAGGSDGSAKTPTTDTTPQSQSKSTSTVVYSGVSGPECPTQRFQRDGYYSDGKEGWATHSGGFGGYGCAGKYLSMPMSGSSSKDSGGSATWLFDLPDSARKCSISVHVPGSSDVVRVGGDPSYYTVYDRFLPRSGNLVGSFYLNQQDRRGTWYNVPGTFPIEAKKLSVRIHDRGRDSNYEHHAISAIKATCTS
ncbi:hypothetical protein ACH4A3_11555 [Streptomyces sp. NPDC018007]|uniref:hypothetical protein n=1 Tax=unclassified Streptomyces TaxID=2593676 RepID=UPI0037BB9DB2|nr:hypothetical protein OG543_09280 [Streptomyces sp. NBC_01178]